jgi:hypothetical protein
LGHIFPASGELFSGGGHGLSLLPSGWCHPGHQPGRGQHLSLKCASGFSVASSEDNALAGLLQEVKAQGQRGVNKFPEKLANLFP